MSWAALGESPGRIEDRKGKPFVGPAGRFLRKNLKEVGLDPSSGYYLNAISCYPKVQLTEEHAMACRQNLIDQWNAMDAAFVLVCGTVALKAVMPRANRHTKGLPVFVHNKWVFPVYHPSYVLFHDPNVAPKWKEDLARFSLMVKWGVDIVDQWATKCAYCRRFEYPACQEHMKDWKADQKWKIPPPPQLTLNL